jgi:DNA-binding MarR family transcriptional regulator
MDSPERITRIHEEIKQTRPFRSRSQEAMIAIARAASMVERQTARVLSPFGVSTAQYNVLRILRGAGPAGLPTLAIRDRLIDPAAAITRLVDKLDRAGLIVRERTETDRRQVTCRITKAGLELLVRIDPVVDALDDMLLSRLQEDELEAFNRQLDRIRAGLRAGGCC